MIVGIAGANGRMGGALIEAAQASGHSIMAHARNLDTLAQYDETIRCTNSVEKLVQESDVVIDFTRPELTIQLAPLCAAHHTPLISGTTGLDESQAQILTDAGSNIAVVWAPNMSIGVNLLMGLVKQAAAKLDESYDIEIVEMHHRHKVDSPSGTALGLGHAAAEGRQIELSKHAVLSREGDMGERKRGSIGFATMRGGSVIGDHTVVFAGDHDRIELTHKSQDRSIYAQGAIKAAEWAKSQPNGFYSMVDVLDLR